MVDYLLPVLVKLTGEQVPGLPDVRDGRDDGEVYVLVLFYSLERVGDDPPEMRVPAATGYLLDDGVVVSVVVVLLPLLLQTELALAFEHQPEETFHVHMDIILAVLAGIEAGDDVGVTVVTLPLLRLAQALVLPLAVGLLVGSLVCCLTSTNHAFSMIKSRGAPGVSVPRLGAESGARAATRPSRREEKDTYQGGEGEGNRPTPRRGRSTAPCRGGAPHKAGRSASYKPSLRSGFALCDVLLQ